MAGAKYNPEPVESLHNSIADGLGYFASIFTTNITHSIGTPQDPTET